MKGSSTGRHAIHSDIVYGMTIRFHRSTKLTAPGSAAVSIPEPGRLIESQEARRVSLLKPSALLAIASPTVLGRAIDTSVLDAAGYPEWRAERRADLVDVQSVRISFSARLPEGGTERQSGMLHLPVPVEGKPRSLTWVVFLRGTEHLRDNVPSRGGGSERSLMEATAALGYAVWAPDYAGSGDAEGAQEYCVPESMAASALDGLSAARIHVAKHSAAYAETGRLVVLGYSQGGLATMATLAAAAKGTIPVPGLRIVAGYPMGAPLDLLIGVPFLKTGSSIVERPDYSILLVLGWARAYPDRVKVQDILSPAIIQEIVPLIDGTRDGEELCRRIARAVGKKPDSVTREDLYRPEYLDAIRNAPETVPYHAARSANRLDQWTAPAELPIVLAATPDDELVPFLNSQNAYDWIQHHNPAAEVSLVRLESGNHGRAAVEGLLYALVDMDLRERKALV